MTEIQQGDTNSPQTDKPAPQQQQQQQPLQQLQQEGTLRGMEQQERKFIIHQGLVALYG